MDTLAKFIATHVQPGPKPQRIAGLRLLERRDGAFEDAGVTERAAVFDLLADGQRIFVWDADADGLGAEIEAVDAQGDRFLRTDHQQLLADNLGSLPRL